MTRWLLAILLLTATLMRYLGTPADPKSPEIRLEGIALGDDLAQVERVNPHRFREWPIHTGGRFNFFEVVLQSREEKVTYVEGYHLSIDSRRFGWGNSPSEFEAALGPAVLISTDSFGHRVYHWPGHQLGIQTLEDGQVWRFTLGIHRDNNPTNALDPPPN